MNCRPYSTPPQRQRWWQRGALLGAAVAALTSVHAQVGSNYTFSQSTGTYTPITGGTVLVTQTTTTTSNAGSLDDGTTYAVPIPFTFTFDGVGYTSCTVTNNGSVSFGGTPITASTYSPINGTGTYAGAIGAYARDLQGGYIFSANRTSGSPVLTMGTGGSTAGVTVGSIISGTGIPVGATVLSFDATSVTMSANATSTGTNTAAWVWNGEMRYETVGVSPNREFVIQWSNMKPWGTTLTIVNSFRMNMQVRLKEADNAVEVVYGACSPGAATSTTTAQVGLRGPTNVFPANVNNRLNTKGVNDNWNASVAGTSNSSAMLLNNVAPANVIPNGLTYRWFDPPCASPSANVTLSPLNCATGQYTATVNVTALGDAPNVNIISSIHGTIATGVSTGSYPSNPNALGTPESFTVVHTGNAICNVPLGPVVLNDGDNTCHVANSFPIPDNGCGVANFLDLPFCVSDPGTALGTDVYVSSVELVIAHTYLEDLEIQLINPNGTPVDLVVARFGSGDNLGTLAGCTPRFILQDGGTPLTTLPTSNVVGTYAPEQSLTTLHDGSDPNGVWTLRICDSFGADVGDVRFVKVNLIPCLAPTASSSSTNDCSTGTYTASVNVTALGTSASVDITSSVHGTLFTGVGTGLYSSNPTTLGTPETITVVASNPACNLTYTFTNADNDNVCQAANTFAIPDGGCSTLNFLNVPFCVSDPGTALGTDVFVQSVDLIIAHTWNDDMDIQLINPNGTAVNLVLDRFGSGDNLGNPTLCPGGLFTLQAGGAALSNTATSNVVGTFAPEQPLSTLHDASDPNGTWTLRVCDDTNFGTGDLRFVRVNLVPCEAPVAGGQTIVPACGTNEYFIDVNLTSLGSSASVDLSNSYDANVVTANATGVWQVGPFPSGTTVTVTLEASNALCDVNLAPQTYNCPPPNDACGGAIAVNCNSITNGNTQFATLDAVGTCTTSLNTAPGVWYTVTGTGGEIKVALCGSAYDTKLGVFTGTCGSLVCLEGNDDDNGTNGINVCSNDLHSSLSFPSTSGTTYYILVTGFSTNAGAFSLEVTCAGNNLPPCQDNSVTLNLRTDDFGSETSWSIVPFGNTLPVCSGSGYPNNADVTATCCLIDGCYDLNVFDSFGDGISLSTPAGLGGYSLVDGLGNRIIDNTADGDDFTFTSSAASPFCLPLGTDKLLFSSCDREDWTPNEFVVAAENAAVSAEWTVGDQTDDGYQFWFFNPDGGYNRRIFRNHATSGGFGPPSATRACHVKISSMVTAPVPFDVLLNVRVRSRVNGTYSEFGPACRFLMPSTPPACPTTSLVNNPGNPNFSCGVTRTFGGSGKVYANPVAGANKYRWRFERDGGGFTRVIATNTATLVLNWLTQPLVDGDTYNVTVAASFDNGANYCEYGLSCQVTIDNTPGAQPRAMETASGFSLYPNPNRGDQVVLNITDLPESEVLVTVDIVDVFGKRVMSLTEGAQNGSLNLVLALDNSLASGLYTVQVTAGEQTFTERLVINK